MLERNTTTHNKRAKGATKVAKIRRGFFYLVNQISRNYTREYQFLSRRARRAGRNCYPRENFINLQLLNLDPGHMLPQRCLLHTSAIQRGQGQTAFYLIFFWGGFFGGICSDYYFHIKIPLLYGVNRRMMITNCTFLIYTIVDIKLCLQINIDTYMYENFSEYFFRYQKHLFQE